MRQSFIPALALAAVATIAAAQEDSSGPILFTNVNVFDGLSETMIENASVVVTDNINTAVSTERLSVAGGQIIDGGGRTMISGLIDVHWHTSYAYAAQKTIATGDILEVAIRGAMGSEKR